MTQDCNIKKEEKERSEKKEVEKLKKLCKETLMKIQRYDSKIEKYD